MTPTRTRRTVSRVIGATLSGAAVIASIASFTQGSPVLGFSLLAGALVFSIILVLIQYTPIVRAQLINLHNLHQKTSPLLDLSCHVPDLLELKKIHPTLLKLNENAASLLLMM